MTIRHRLGPAARLLGCAAALALCNASHAESAQRGAAVFYVPVPSTDFELMAERYDVFIMTDHGWQIDLLRGAKPDAEVYRYNSATDNYVSGANTEEADYLESLAGQKGWDVEDAYLHYWDDTVVTLQGEDKFVPGWGGGSAVTKEEARVPVYYKDLSRRVINVAGYHGSQLNKETLVYMGFDRTFYNSSEYADGVFLDNMGTQFWNTGTIQSGGHVLETPGHLSIGSPEYQTWHWYSAWAPFLASLKDTLESGSQWTVDGKSKKVMINISSSWNSDVPQQDVADIFFLEYQYSPLRNAGDHWVQNAINWDREAASTGGVMMYSAKPVTSITNYQGSVTLDEAKLGNYAWYLITKTDNSLFFQSQIYDAGNPAYVTDNWSGCMDVAQAQFGEPTEEPRVLTTGTDSRGYPYKVYAREYEGGLALLRNRGEWNQHIDAATGVTVTLPGTFYPLAPDGTVGSATTTAVMANGRGALFLKSGESSSGEGVPPDDIRDPEFSFRVLAPSPAYGAQDVAPGTEIRWLLSHAMKTPAQASWVTVSGSLSGSVSGSLQVSGGGRMIVFQPAQPFAPGETVTARLSASIQRQDGETLDGNADGVASDTSVDDDVLIFHVAP